MTNEEQLKKLLPCVADMARILLEQTKAMGFDLYITSGYRTPAEQDRIYSQGRTRPGRIVTYAVGTPRPTGNHCFGIAFDVADRKRGYEIDWLSVGKVGEKCGLEWGGRWSKIVDKPHFQFTGGLTLKELQAGKRPEVKKKIDMNFANQHKGRLFLAVGEGGQLYYIDYKSAKKISLGKNPTEAFTILKKLAVGISNADLAKFPN